MPQDSYIKLEGADELVRKLGIDGFQKQAGNGLLDGGTWLAAKNAEYPPKRKRTMHFTDKARRWFFAALRRGDITVPYRRTGTLGRLWTATKQGWHTVVVGNNAPYARYVQDETDQSDYHKGNWSIAQENARQNLARVMEFVQEHLQGWLSA